MCHDEVIRRGIFLSLMLTTYRFIRMYFIYKNMMMGLNIRFYILKINQCINLCFVNANQIKKTMYFCHRFAPKIGGGNHLPGMEQLRVFYSSCSIVLR